ITLVVEKYFMKNYVSTNNSPNMLSGNLFFKADEAGYSISSATRTFDVEAILPYTITHFHFVAESGKAWEDTVFQQLGIWLLSDLVNIVKNYLSTTLTQLNHPKGK